MSERVFSPREVVVALLIAAGAQIIIAGVFMLEPPEAKEVEISDENARSIAVAITPVPILKKGSKTPGKLPKAWQREQPLVGKGETVAPSKEASTAAAPSRLDAGPPSLSDAGATTTNEAVQDGGPTQTQGGADVASGVASGGTEGHPEGASDGTETDPLKARAADLYRAQLASWFASRFAIQGKIPFEDLKKLRATADVQVSEERHVTHFTIKGSGDPIFDEEVRSTLTKIQSSGLELPAPPPLYPEMLGRTLPVSFRCTIRSQCE